MLLQAEERGASWGKSGEIGGTGGLSSSLSALSLDLHFSLLLTAWPVGGARSRWDWGWDRGSGWERAGRAAKGGRILRHPDPGSD